MSEPTKRRAAAEETDTLLPDPVIEYYKAQVDRDLLRDNLKLTIEQRLENLQFLQIFAEELARRMEALLNLPHRPLADPSF